MKLKIHYQNHGSVGVLLKFLLLAAFFFNIYIYTADKPG